MDESIIRGRVKELYSNPNWAAQVDRMDFYQVYAIYCRATYDPQPVAKPEPVPEDQITLF